MRSLRSATIGTTSPNFKLDVDGQINATNISLASTNYATKPTLSFGDGDTGFFERSDDALTIAAAGTEVAYFDSNELAGLRGDGGARLRFLSPDATVPAFTFVGDNDGGMFRPAANEVGFSTGGSEQVRIDSSGNVGIGTTSPSKQLVVNGTTEGIVFEPDVASPVINTTKTASNSNLTITSSGGSVIITLG